MKFKHDEEVYTFMVERGCWIIYDPDDTLLTVYVGETKPAPTEDVLKLMVDCFWKGHAAGKAEGYSDAQFDMRRVLGIKA